MLPTRPALPADAAPEIAAAPDLSRAVERAYSTLRDWIFDGRLAQGAPLIEQELAERLGVSRTPVREALQRLSVEGLVLLERYRQNTVATFSDRDAEEIYDLRAVLEGFAAGRAATRLDDAALARLRALEDAMEAVVDEAPNDVLGRFLTLNEEFHEIVWRAADNRRVHELLSRRLGVPFFPFERPPGGVEPLLRRACLYHREILAALNARDAERAATQMRAHGLAILSVPL